MKILILYETVYPDFLGGVESRNHELDDAEVVRLAPARQARWRRRRLVFFLGNRVRSDVIAGSSRFGRSRLLIRILRWALLLTLSAR